MAHITMTRIISIPFLVFIFLLSRGQIAYAHGVSGKVMSWHEFFTHSDHRGHLLFTAFMTLFLIIALLKPEWFGKK